MRLFLFSRRRLFGAQAQKAPIGARRLRVGAE